MGMRRTPLSYLLVLLLLLPLLDDAWATVTPDPIDNSIAAENNDFLLAPGRHPQRGPSAPGDLPVIGLADLVTAGALASDTCRPTAARQPTRLALQHSLLYLLMSLRR